MRDKRGQVTIFIIIAIVIIGATIGYFALKDSIKISGIPTNIEPVYTSFLSCLENTGREGIYQVASHGGYYNVPFNTSIVYFIENIPYYYLDSRNYVPSINLVEEELEEYISSNLRDCFDIKNFRKQGFNISEEIYSISAKIDKKSIKISMINSITVKKGEDISQFKNIEVELDYDIKNLHTASKEIVNIYSEKPGYICITCLDDLSKEYHVNIKAIPVTDVSVFENDIIWFFIDNKNDFSKDKLTYVFVVEQ